MKKIIISSLLGVLLLGNDLAISNPDVKTAKEIFNNQNSLHDFIVGTKVSYLKWKANNKVEDYQENNFGSIDYDIGSTLYKTFFIQGIYNGRQVAFSYMRNRLVNSVKNKTSQFFLGYIDLKGGENPIRLSIEKSDIEGIANATAATSTNTDIYGNPIINLPFQTKYLSVELKYFDKFLFAGNDNNSGNNGTFIGIGYSQYKMPSLIGMADPSSGDIVDVFYDPSVRIKNFYMCVGYDTLEADYYARKTRDISDWYFDWKLGLGLQWLSFSDGGRYAENKAHSLGYSKGYDLPMGIALNYKFDIGYIKEIAKVKKYSLFFQTGVLLKGIYAGNTVDPTDSNNDDRDPNTAVIVYDRSDMWYGPFATFSLMF